MNLLGAFLFGAHEIVNPFIIILMFKRFFNEIISYLAY